MIHDLNKEQNIVSQHFTSSFLLPLFGSDSRDIDRNAGRDVEGYDLAGMGHCGNMVRNLTTRPPDALFKTDHFPKFKMISRYNMQLIGFVLQKGILGKHLVGTEPAVCQEP